MRALLLLALASCAVEVPDAPYTWSLPPGFVAPPVPLDNPMSDAKVALGRHLFYDPQLSATGTLRCASCHVQARAFTDGAATSPGVTGQHGRHGAMSLANVAYAASLTWAGDVATLEAQALVPMFGTAPVELATDATLVARLAEDPRYDTLIAAAFPDEPITISLVTRALASFERTILSGEARFDRFVAGDVDALSPLETRGLALFEAVGCAQCHAGFAFTASVGERDVFFNTGLYDVDGTGRYPATDRGLVELTGDAAHEGRFRPPTLRNIALTAPYLHDGSAATLADVIDLYAAGGRGAGATSIRKSPLVRGFALTDDDRAALVAFLGTLTDDALLTDPRFADPW